MFCSNKYNCFFNMKGKSFSLQTSDDSSIFMIFFGSRIQIYNIIFILVANKFFPIIFFHEINPNGSKNKKGDIQEQSCNRSENKRDDIHEKSTSFIISLIILHDRHYLPLLSQ